MKGSNSCSESPEESEQQTTPATPNEPVIMMSGYMEEGVAARFIGMGVVGFLQKPFNRDTLLTTVRKALESAAV